VREQQILQIAFRRGGLAGDLFKDAFSFRWADLGRKGG
jgi:hypothetical protein